MPIVGASLRGMPASCIQQHSEQQSQLSDLNPRLYLQAMKYAGRHPQLLFNLHNSAGACQLNVMTERTGDGALLASFAAVSFWCAAA